MPEINRRQAMVPEGADVLPNGFGTAPGLWLEHDGRVLLLLPGPAGRAEADARARGRRAPGADVPARGRLFRRVLRICGRTESEVDETRRAGVLARGLAEPLPVATTVLTSPAQVELHLSRARGRRRPRPHARLDAAAADMAALFGADLFSIDGRAIEEVVGELLRDRGWRIGGGRVVHRRPHLGLG